MMYVLNGFSPNMLGENGVDIYFENVDINKVKSLLKEGFQSAIGHKATAELLTAITGIRVPYERKEVQLHPGDRGIIITVAFRPEEGRVYSFGELTEFLEERKIRAYYFVVVG